MVLLCEEHLRSGKKKEAKMYLKERVYWDTLARVLRLDGREGEEGGQQNGNLTRELQQ